MRSLYLPTVALLLLLPAVVLAGATVSVPAAVVANTSGQFSITVDVTGTAGGETLEAIGFQGVDNVGTDWLFYDYGCSQTIAPGEVFKLTHADQLLSFNLNGSITVRVDFCGAEPQFMTVVVVNADPSVPVIAASWGAAKARYR